MTTSIRRHVGPLLAGALLIPFGLSAQGNLSTQGFGYPQGQLSTRALGTGGAIGEFDPTTPLNPGSIGLLTNRTVLFQVEPEYRTLTSGSVVERTTTARYPVIFAGVPFGERWVTSVSSSTLLDRSWSTSTSRFAPVGTDSVFTTFKESSSGAINDVRVAEAWSNRTWLYVGVGIHGITGRNVVSTGREFSDTTNFSSFAATRTVSYSGTALSAGAQFIAAGTGVIGVSYRRGGRIRARTNDSTLAQGNVPDHVGVSAAYSGISGSVFAVRAAHDKWSSLNSMIETPGQQGHDTWDLSGGAEVPGPRFGSQTILLRSGVRTRTLPFEAASTQVTERSLSLGSGLALGRGRMVIDITGVRQWRTSQLPSVQERAWTLSLSLTARP